MNEIEELSLLAYASRGDKEELVKAMCNYTGCNPEDYTEYRLIRLFQKAISDISRKYHIKDLFFNYCDARNSEKVYCDLYKKEYLESEVLASTLFSIMPGIFDEEDKTKIRQLRNDYYNPDEWNIK